MHGNMPTVNPEQGELRTITQLVTDASEVCQRFYYFLPHLTFIVGTHSLPIIPGHGPIRFSCHPNTSCPLFPTFIPPGHQRHQI